MFFKKNFNLIIVAVFQIFLRKIRTELFSQRTAQAKTALLIEYGSYMDIFKTIKE